MLIKTFLKFALITALLTPIPASAQVFIKRDENKGPTESQDSELNELLSDEEIQKEKSAPEPRTINDFANAYYKNCMKTDHPILKGENKDMMCGCTSAQIPDVMTVQQMQAMQEDTTEGKKQRNRMLMFVYTPCIEFPTKALILDQCMNNEELKASMPNFAKVCTCLSDGVAGYMKEHAPRAVQSAIRRNRNDFDPLADLLQSKQYEKRTQYYMETCVAEHALGRR